MIEAIFVSKKSRQPRQGVNEVQVVFGSGITGARHFKKAKRPEGILLPGGLRADVIKTGILAVGMPIVRGLSS